jgi:hypothetical protein
VDRSRSFSFGWGGFCGRIGMELLCRMLWMVSSSCWYLSASKLYMFNLLYRNLTAVYLCCVGWLDVYGIMVSVKVGFL